MRNGFESRVRRTPARAAAATGLAFTLLAALATGGVPLVDSSGTPYQWDLVSGQPNVIDGKVTAFLDPDGTSDPITGPDSDLQALRNAIAEWEIETTEIRFEEDPTRSANGKNANDRVNYVGFVTSGMGAGTFAQTTPTRNGSQITDMDITFNDRDFTWNTRAPGSDGVADIEAIMTHEWGHAIGLDHVPLRTSTMYFTSSPGATSERTLEPDDRAIIGSIYPNEAFREQTGSIAGRVTRLGATDHRSIHVVAVSVVSGEPAASALTAPNGDYVLDGLPRGAYRVLACPAVPLGAAMNSFWRTGSMNFVPAVLGVSTGGPREAASVAVVPGEITAGASFTVAAASNPLESDGSAALATPIALGDAVGSRLESASDVDYFVFQGQAGQRVNVSVLAWQLGSDADPSITLESSAGVPFATTDDIRGDNAENQIAGPNFDARLTGVALAGAGNTFVRVSNQSSGSDVESFYVLFVSATSDAPSPELTTVQATPMRLDADGASTSLVTVTPFKQTGDQVGPGATVTITNDGDGAVGPVTDVGNGTYTATVTAPTTPGDDRLSVSVTTNLGTATSPSAESLVYLGPANGATSNVTVAPRRIRRDGEATSLVSIEPRDLREESLGTGRGVAASVVGPADVTVGASSDVGNGLYEVTVTAGTTAGAATISVDVDGVRLADVGTVHVGFPLGDVLTQSDADIAEHLAPGTLANKVRNTLESAQKQVAKAQRFLDVDNLTKALAVTRKAQTKVLSAAKKAKGALDDPGTAVELAEAIREAASTAIDQAVVVTGKDQQKLAAARSKLADGDVFQTQALDPKSAAKRYLQAFKKATKLQPD